MSRRQTLSFAKLFKVCLLAATLGSLPAFGFFTTMTTGDLAKEGTYKGQFETQFITNADEGVNLVGHVDGGISSDLNWRGELGIGTTDFHVAGMVKWIPIPDIDNQPALGLMGGIGYAQYEYDVDGGPDKRDDELSLRIHPLISKRFKVNFGELVPYGSIPVGISSFNDDTYYPAQLVVGSELKTLYWDNVTFQAEIGFDLGDSFTYVSVGVNFSFDGSSLGGSSSSATPMGGSGFQN